MKRGKTEISKTILALKTLFQFKIAAKNVRVRVHSD